MPSHLDPWGLAPGKSYNGSAFWVLPGCVDTGGFPFPGPHTFLMRCLPPPYPRQPDRARAMPSAQTCSSAHGTGRSTSPSDHMNPTGLTPAHKRESCLDTLHPTVS